MRRLFLVTNGFPYGKGEEFLEAEILILKRYFNVILVPIQINDNQKRDYDLEIDLRLFQLINKSKIRLIIAWFGWVFCNLTLLVCDIKKTGFSFRAFIGRTVRVYYAKKYFKLLNKTLKSDDILYFFWLEYPILAAKMANITVPLISRAHGYDVYQERWTNGYIPIQSSLISCASYVYAASFDACDYLRKLYPQKKEKITFSPLGINKLYQTNQMHRFDNKFSFVSCSNIVPVKRVSLIIELLSYLYKDNIDFHWTHIGGGELIEDIKELANKKISGRFTFTGPLLNFEVQEILSKTHFDLFITTTESEGGRPVSIMEAQAYGIPVLATNVGGVPEIISNDVGWLVDKNFNMEEVAFLLKNIIFDKQLLKTKSINSFNNYIQFFDANKNYVDFCEIIKSL